MIPFAFKKLNLHLALYNYHIVKLKRKVSDGARISLPAFFEENIRIYGKDVLTPFCLHKTEGFQGLQDLPYSGAGGAGEAFRDGFHRYSDLDFL